MQLETTYRGMAPAEAGAATHLIEKGSARFERVVEEPATLRAVVEAGAALKVTLTLIMPHGELTTTGEGHDLGAVVSEVCDKLKTRAVRHRHRREANRHRAMI